ncbi:type II toxin-antitoxin system RelE/ParE family toxin [Limnohabitans radicicola]|uniref:Type II toxin-antitoxin system YafQ family toxin n=1 Tax=Limnohabitans radicicola TaxID=2771427 RepID=A0A927FKZ0_9BURK|nr:type II toxin-antitoxin system YafQ family toxin [Limnohabitans radicicola]MBD8052018.1 type II toxin-antitoxin system YafQ family toxin [Limnohabitans radicicola]
MRHIESSGAFRKQLKLMIRRGKDEAEIKTVIVLLASDEPLPPKYRDHALTGNFTGFRDCHIQPDWLLIYHKQDSEDGRGILRLEATGTHSDLF